MNKQKEYGSFGEQLATDFLLGEGYKLLFRNWRFKYWELDIIAMDNATLVFVEVKSRTNLNFGKPEQFVDWKKQKNMIRAAESYIRQYRYEGEIRFDVVSVYLETKNVELIKDAFWSN